MCPIKMNATAYAPPIGQRKRDGRRTGREAFSGRAATISTSLDGLDRSGEATSSHTALELEVNKGLFNLLSKENRQGEKKGGVNQTSHRRGQAQHHVQIVSVVLRKLHGDDR